MTNTVIHLQLTAKLFNDEYGTTVMLTQHDEIEEPQSVLLHPWQLRAVCEQFGIIASDTKAAQTIATLQRRMASLRDRINNLNDSLTHCSNLRNADLSHELASISALSDLASEWCADFDSKPSSRAVEPDSVAAQCTSASPGAQASLL